MQMHRAVSRTGACRAAVCRQASQAADHEDRYENPKETGRSRAESINHDFLYYIVVPTVKRACYIVQAGPASLLCASSLPGHAVQNTINKTLQASGLFWMKVLPGAAQFELFRKSLAIPTH